MPIGRAKKFTRKFQHFETERRYADTIRRTAAFKQSQEIFLYIQVLPYTFMAKVVHLGITKKEIKILIGMEWNET